MSDAACVVCGATTAPRVLRAVRDHVTGERFDVDRCRRCGFATTRPVPASLDLYYARNYRKFNRLAAALLRRLYLRRVDRWLQHLPPYGSALEVGSGTGWMLRALYERGWRAVGSERTLEAALGARRGGRVPMFAGDLEAVRPEPALDLVIMFHVLEHLADPLAALRAVAARIRPGGSLVLGLPNLASWQAAAAGRDWMHLDVPRHLCHFTPDAIERALVASGFRIARIDFRSWEHDPLGWVQSALDRLGFEQGLILKRLIGLRDRRGGPLATVAALALAIPLGLMAFPLAVASWRAGAGAVMEVWATRDG